jgi:hypothetical protein
MGETTDLDVFDGSLADLQAFAASGTPPCGTIAAGGGEIDLGDACFADGGPAATLRDVSGAGAHGELIWTHATDAATEGNFAQWDLDFAEAGTYRIEVYTDTAYAQSKQAAYVVAASGTRQTVVVDQSAANGWQALGDIAFAAGSGQFVHLGDNTGEPGAGNVQLVFDAVRLTRLDGTPNSDPQPAPAGCATSSPGLGAGVIALALARRRQRT